MVVSQSLQERYRKEHGVEAFYVPNGGILRERSEPRKILDWGLEPENYILFLEDFLRKRAATCSSTLTSGSTRT